MSRTSACLDMKSHPNITGMDNCFTTRKVWSVENFPSVTVANDVPKGEKDLPSALMNWTICSGEIYELDVYINMFSADH